MEIKEEIEYYQKEVQASLDKITLGAMEECLDFFKQKRKEYGIED